MNNYNLFIVLLSIVGVVNAAERAQSGQLDATLKAAKSAMKSKQDNKGGKKKKFGGFASEAEIIVSKEGDDSSGSEAGSPSGSGKDLYERSGSLATARFNGRERRNTPWKLPEPKIPMKDEEDKSKEEKKDKA